MKKYVVATREVWIQLVEVEALGPKHAILLVKEGEGTYSDEMEYSHTLDTETWTVEEI